MGNQVVENHSGTHLDKFAVVFRLDKRHSTLLDNWISFAVKKRVKEIKIKLGPLRINGEGFNESYSFIRSAPFLPGIECLTSLELRYVYITRKMIEHLLLVCPLLERLSLDNKFLLNLRVVGPSLKLKYLVITLGDHRYPPNIEICAPNLVSLHCRVPPSTTPCVENLCCLSDLYVNVWSLHDSLVQFSSYFSQLETLTYLFNKDYRYYGDLKLPALDPQLTNLKHLTIKLVYVPDKFNTSYLTNVIDSCPLLHKFTLEFSEEFQRVAVSWGNWCSHQYLKVVEITKFIGQRHEIRIAKYFLSRVSNLEKFIIDTHCHMYNRKRKLLTVVQGSIEKAKYLRSKVPSGVEFLVL